MEKEKELSKGALCKYFDAHAHLQRHLDISAHLADLRKAGQFCETLSKTVSGQTAKQYLWLINSCWDWSYQKYHVASDNPWTAQIQRIKLQPRQCAKSFSRAEIKTIISAFNQHPRYNHYGDLVHFLFGVGCLCWEAAGLRWKHIATDYSTV